VSKQRRATPEQQSLVQAQQNFLQNWKEEQETRVALARKAIDEAVTELNEIERALKELV